MTERVSDAAIDRIREHVKAQVARTSLRKVAKRAAVKVGATKKFIDGSVPYERNLRLWKRYYARELREGVAGNPDDAVPMADAAAVLELLLWAFPDQDRPNAQFQAVELFRDLYLQHGRTPPAWVHDLLEAGPPAPSSVSADDGDDDEDGDEGDDEE
ncbi:hypothetical protein [Longimicrobium sp.]|uniref:hypothetical protein n=1 Tax=Longimicrobium sp. TaxID=2029185 RepID=UPI002E311A27|nr:hypothetical protein [Longimicrobium sp.]HEX6038525.1 hypothetical protein [Longimicrobium sp.]